MQEKREVWNKEVLVFNGRRKTNRYWRWLRGMGFQAVSAKGHSAWLLRARLSEQEVAYLKRGCRKRKLDIVVTDRNLTRSQNYRKIFREQAQTRHGKYRCAYCGRKLTENKVTVDHIIPVKRFRGNKSKFWLTLLRINDINDPKNLAPACQKCNQKKGARGGLWILRGLVGRNYDVRVFMNWIRWLFITVIVLMGVYVAYTIIQTTSVVQ